MATLAQPNTRKQRKAIHGTCRLILSINGTAYSVRPISADSFAALRAFRLRKADGTTYDVAQTIHGLECDCPDFVFHRGGRGVRRAWGQEGVGSPGRLG